MVKESIHFGDEAFGKEVRQTRRLRRLTQQQVADMADIGLSTLRSIETGNGSVRPLLAALKVLRHRFTTQSDGVGFPQWLRERRKSAMMSQERLADESGLSKPTIMQLERERGNLSSL
jgi:transcriptional regulator with XRE-family HTH domain